jgi:hypothetical protein
MHCQCCTQDPLSDSRSTLHCLHLFSSRRRHPAAHFHPSERSGNKDSGSSVRMIRWAVPCIFGVSKYVHGGGNQFCCVLMLTISFQAMRQLRPGILSPRGVASHHPFPTCTQMVLLELPLHSICAKQCFPLLRTCVETGFRHLRRPFPFHLSSIDFGPAGVSFAPSDGLSSGTLVAFYAIPVHSLSKSRLPKMHGNLLNSC